jgi:regulator of protease activity HflC (stomatin/prohibitin superfamily)
MVESVKIYDIRTQKADVVSLASSKDLQTVTVQLAVNYTLDPAKLLDFVKNIGDAYESKILQPSIQESVKSITARYTAEELITKREEVRIAIQKSLVEKMAGNGILVAGINITNFEFSKSFNDAIELKVTAEQNALAAKNKKDQVQYEADQTVIRAKAEAESIKIQVESINKAGGEDYVRLQWIEKV